MVPRRPPEPPTPEQIRQRSLDHIDDGEVRGRLRDVAEHSDTIVAMAISRERWAWLRSLTGSALTWAGIAFALLVALRDEIATMLGRGGQ